MGKLKAHNQDNILHKAGKEGVLIVDHTVGGHTFPANRTSARLVYDLLSDDTSTYVALFDTVDHYRNDYALIPVDKLYFYPDHVR